MAGRSFLRGLVMSAICLTAAVMPCAGAAPVAIRVWLPGFEAYKEVMTKDFQAAYPGIKLELVNQDPQKLRERLLAAVAAKSAPDLALVKMADFPGFCAVDACEPLDYYLADLRDQAGIDPILLRLLSVQGKVRGVPVVAHPMALYFRADWLGRLGLKPPANWAEFEGAALAMKAKDPDGNGKDDTYGLAERWPADDLEVATRFLPWLFQAGGIVAKNEGSKWVPGFGQSGGVKALRLRRRLWEAGAIPPGAPSNSREQNLALFTSGQAGMLVEDERCIPAVRAALGPRAATVPLPADIRMCTVGDGFCFVLLRSGLAKWEAFTFVQWWLSRDVQMRLLLGWDAKIGGSGADAGVLTLTPRNDLDPAVLLGEPLVMGFQQGLRQLVPEPFCPNYEGLKRIMAKAAAEAMGPQKTVEEILAAATKEATALLAAE